MDAFLSPCKHSSMFNLSPPAPDFRPATREEVMSALTFALSIDTHSRYTRASVDFMAALAAG